MGPTANRFSINSPFLESVSASGLGKLFAILSHRRLQETREASIHPQKRTVNQEFLEIQACQTRAP